jgi:hypothetical protein
MEVFGMQKILTLFFPRKILIKIRYGFYPFKEIK